MLVRQCDFWGSIVSENREALLRFLMRRHLNAADAADVIQDAYLRLVRVDAPQEIDNPRAFLFKTAANLATNLVVQQRRHRQHHKEIAALDLADSRALVDRQSLFPEAHVDARQQLAIVRDAVGELPAKCRRVFVMHRFEGLSYSEIAMQLNVSKGTVEKHMSRALQHCHKRLKRRLKSGGTS